MLLRLKFKYKSWKNSNSSFSVKSIFMSSTKHIIMNFELNSFTICTHMIFIMIYLQMKCFRNLLAFLL